MGFFGHNVAKKPHFYLDFRVGWAGEAEFLAREINPLSERMDCRLFHPRV